jgi:probable HAF family extracellular repeat protein
MRRRFVLKVVVTGAVSVLLGIHPAAAQTRSVTDLGTLRTDGAGSSSANAINNNGVVVGDSTTDDGSSHGFQTRPNSPINPATDDVGTFPGGSTSTALGVNVDSLGGAQTVGQANLPQPSAGPNSLAYVGAPPPHGVAPLQDGTDHVARAINSAGQAVGQAVTTMFRAVMWDSTGGITDLNTLVPAGSDWVLLSDANGINDMGQIAGAGIKGSLSRAFVMGGGITDLGVLPGTLFSAAAAINATGTVVGFSAGGVAPFGVAFMWDPVNGMQNLGTLPGDDGSRALGINNVGQVVGVSFNATTTGVATAVLWQNGMITDLNTLIGSGSGWMLGIATGINDSGQIVGGGFHNGSLRGFLM